MSLYPLQNYGECNNIGIIIMIIILVYLIYLIGEINYNYHQVSIPVVACL